MRELKYIENVYFIGIGGIGMSAIARYFVSIGKQVAGYDKTPTDITKQNSVYIRSSVRRISAEGLKKSSAKLVPKGSLLVCTRATIGEMAITAHEMCTNQGFKNIIPNQKTNIEFLFYLLT